MPNATGIALQGGTYDNTIGGTLPGAGNLISGNGRDGIYLDWDGGDIFPTNNLVQGNLIGTDKTGTVALGNLPPSDGIGIQFANNNTIGGTAPGAGNTIAFNSGYGVHVDSGTGNSILGNSIFSNASLGIFLNSANNANNNQAFPVLTGVSSSGSGTTITGTLQSAANTTFRIEFFANPALDPSGYGQGQTYLGAATVNTDANGYLASSPDGSAVITNPDTANATFTATALAPVPAGQVVLSATATHLATGDTSQFSHDGVLTVTTLTSSANPSVMGQPVTITASVSAAAAGIGTPTGSVDFVDTTTGTDLGTVALSGGSAAVTTSFVSGTHVIEAVYAGDGTFLGSTGTLSQTVLPSITVLNPTASGALTLSGNANINVPGNIVVDSSSKTALVESGNASITAASIQVVGGDSKSGNATWSPAPVTGAASVSDPLAGLAVPSVSGSRSSVSVAGNSSLTINPGIFTSISVSGNGKLTLNPGIYVIAGGGFSVSGNGSVSGSGVMIYNAGSAYPNAGGSFGAISFSGNTTVSLSAATSGPYAGVLIFQSRDNYRSIAVSGNASASSGTIYAADAALVLSGNANLPHLSAVVNTLSLSGGAFQLTDGATSDFVSSTANQILYGTLTVAVQDDTGNGLDPNEFSDIGAAMTYLNDALGSFGVYLSWAAPGTDADVHIHFASNTPYGGAGDGVLGFTTATNDVYLVTTGWSFYTGADPSAIGAGQYDFLTLATHELAHTVGLGESSDPNSVMYEYLAPGTVRRTFTDSNLSLINTDADRFMKAALPTAHYAPMLPGQAASLAVFSAGAALLLDRATETDFGGMLFQTSLNPQKDGHVATTPALDGDDSVLVGGAGNDLVIGGQGRNLMTGGFGFDHVVGAGGDHAAQRASDQVFASLDDGTAA